MPYTIRDFRVNSLPGVPIPNSRYYVPNGQGTDLDEYLTDLNGNYRQIKPIISSVANAWDLNGNIGTDQTVNFLGTTSPTGLAFRTNNNIAGLIENSEPQAPYYARGTGAASVFLGSHAGEATIAHYGVNGGHSTHVGTYAGRFSKSGANTFIGFHAGYLHTNPGAFGGRNVAIGNWAMNNGYNAYDNTAVGTFALNSIIEGVSNVALGRDALKSYSFGHGSVALGAYALLNSSTSISGITITNGGSGYTTATITFSAPQFTGAAGQCATLATGTAIISGGAIIGVTMTEIGCGYMNISSPITVNELGANFTWNPATVTITGDGTGATATPIFAVPEGNIGVGGYSGLYDKAGRYNTYLGVNSYTANWRWFDTYNLFAGVGAAVDISIPSSTVITKSSAIGYNARVGQSNSMILGGTGADQPVIGIGTIAPDTTQMLHVNGSTKVNNLRLHHATNGTNFSTAAGTSTYSLPYLKPQNTGSAILMRLSNNGIPSSYLSGYASVMLDLYHDTGSAATDQLLRFASGPTYHSICSLRGLAYQPSIPIRFIMGNESYNAYAGIIYPNWTWGLGDTIYTEDHSTISALTVSSVNKGFLPPRLSTAVRTSIAAVEGLLVFDTDVNSLFQYNGTIWQDLYNTGSTSPLTTKGDLYTYSTLDARLPVGTDGQILSADSSEATGLKWITSGGSGETNTASNLGGGLANYSTKVGVDLQFNSFNATDFDLAANLISIDATLKGNWNTAFGWGDWSTGVDKAFIDALNVDADTLDGIDSTGFALASHTHLLAAGATDVTATATELNLLDLAGLTAGWVLSADSATTASWKAPSGGYTDEQAQDAIGAMVDTTIEYTDGTPLLSRAALTGAITASAGSNTTALGSFTKSQLDTAVSDGNIVYVGDLPTDVYGEEHTGLTGTTVTLSNSGITGTLRIYKNGVRLDSTEFSYSGGTSVTVTGTLSSGDMIICDYKY